MPTVMFYGASDDLIEVEGDIPGCDEFGGEVGRFEVAGLRVQVDYMAHGCWGIRVVQIDESVPVTATNIALVAPVDGEGSFEYPGYSLRLRMDVPEGSHVTKVAVS